LYITTTNRTAKRFQPKKTFADIYKNNDIGVSIALLVSHRFMTWLVIGKHAKMQRKNFLS